MQRLIALLIGLLLAALVCGVALWVQKRAEGIQELEIRAVDAYGEPIERFGVVVWEMTRGSMVYSSVPEGLHSGGIARVCIPLHGVGIEVYGEGLQRTTVGPFEPTIFSTRLDISIPDQAAVVGTVTFENRPVEGAQVMLACQWINVVDGTPSGLLYGSDNLCAKTDALGAFRVGSDYRLMPYYVRALKIGYAPAMVGPVRPGDPPILLRLGEGGSIAGRVLFPIGRESSGTEIELYRIDLPDGMMDVYGRSVLRADRLGRFEFRNVEPGPWLLRVKPPETLLGESELLSAEHLPFLVDVAEYQSTHIVMDLTEDPARIEGHMVINGKPWSSALVYLHTIGEMSLVIDVARADQDGRWTLQAHAAGRYRMVAWGDSKHAREPKRLSDIVELSRKTNRWEHVFTWHDSDASEIVLDRK